MNCIRSRRVSSLFSASLAASVLIACLGGCGISGPPDEHWQEPNVVSIKPQDWSIFYSAGMPSQPSADSEGEWSLELPNAGTGGHVNYVQTPFTATNPPQDVTITFTVDSTTPQYSVSDSTDKPPATVRLFFEQQGDDLHDPNGRWWANASTYNLGSNDGTTMTFTIPFTSDQWTNVDGQHDPEAFADALNNIGWIGITFGGQYFAGHGAALSSGTAKYVLISYRVEVETTMAQKDGSYPSLGTGECA